MDEVGVTPGSKTPRGFESYGSSCDPGRRLEVMLFVDQLHSQLQATETMPHLITR